MVHLGESCNVYETLDDGKAFSSPASKCTKWPAALQSKVLPCLAFGLLTFVIGQRTAELAPMVPQVVRGPVQQQEAPPTLWKPRDIPIYRFEPKAKSIVRHFDAYLMNQVRNDEPSQKMRNVAQWLAPDFVYETISFPSTYSLKQWVQGELKSFGNTFPDGQSFSQMLFFGDALHATTTSYGTVHWMGDLFGVPPLGDWTYFRVTDFYQARKNEQNETLINWNLMMIDWADLLRRAGNPVLPASPLKEGLFLSSAANDGVPAPLSVVAAERDSVSAQKAAVGALNDCWARDMPAETWWHANLTFYGPGGIGLARGTGEFQQHVLEPFRGAFANRSSDIGMLFCEGNYCASYGHLRGQHVGTWLGQPASYKQIAVRYGMHWRVVGNKIQEGWAMFDVPGFFDQLGKDFWAEARRVAR